MALRDFSDRIMSIHHNLDHYSRSDKSFGGETFHLHAGLVPMCLKTVLIVLAHNLLIVIFITSLSAFYSIIL